MRGFGEEERGEIAVIFDAGIIIGLCRENRGEETHEERLYRTIEKLLSSIGREIGGRVAMSVDQETIKVICRKFGMNTKEIESFEKEKLQKLARLSSNSKQIATLRPYRSSTIESKLKKSTKLRKIWGNGNISEKFRRYFGEEDAKFARVAVVEWSKPKPTLLITTDYEFSKRIREKIPRLKVEHIEKQSLNFESLMAR